MKKIFFKIYTFIHYLFSGLHNADKVIMGSGDENKDIGGGIELHDEEDSVYKDLLKGEVTQEVKELRHEMYQSERKSNKYRYVGNGMVEKKTVFSDYGNIDIRDGYKVILIQENKKIEDSISKELEDNYIDFDGEYTIDITREFIPRLKLEEYTDKIVVKQIREEALVVDFYTTTYQMQFDRKHRIFLNEVESIKNNGNIKSDLIDFDELSFVTKKAYGADDLNIFVFGMFSFKEIVEWEGNYIIRFNAMPIVFGEDITEQYFDEIAQEKSDNHEARGDGKTASYIIVPKESKEKTNKELETLKENNISL